MSGQTLVVVRHPDKCDLDVLRTHIREGDDDLVVLLDYEGDVPGTTKFAKFLVELGKSHRHFPHPSKAWEAESAAKAFCRSEAERCGHSLSEGLAEIIVERSGDDLGILSFEIMKMAMLADIDGSTEITKHHVGGALAALTDLSPFPVITCLFEHRQSGALAIQMNRFRKRLKNDPTLLITSEMGKAAAQLIVVHELVKQKMSVEDISGRTKIPAWIVKTKTIPSLNRWPYVDLLRLMRILASSDRAVLNGSVNPWVHLTSQLLGLCR